MTATRRNMIGLMAGALAVAPVPAVASIQSADHELLSLHAKWLKASAVAEDLYEKQNRAFEAAKAALKVPDALWPRGFVKKGDLPDHAAGLPILRRGEHYRPIHRDRVRSEVESNRRAFESCGVNRRSLQRCEEVLVALDKYEADWTRLKEETGFNAAENAYVEADAVVIGLEEQMVAIRPATLDGFRIKAKLVEKYVKRPASDDNGELDVDDRALWTLIDDLLGKARA